MPRGVGVGPRHLDPGRCERHATQAHLRPPRRLQSRLVARREPHRLFLRSSRRAGDLPEASRRVRRRRASRGVRRLRPEPRELVGRRPLPLVQRGEARTEQRHLPRPPLQARRSEPRAVSRYTGRGDISARSVPTGASWPTSPTSRAGRSCTFVRSRSQGLPGPGKWQISNGAASPLPALATRRPGAVVLRQGRALGRLCPDGRLHFPFRGPEAARRPAGRARSDGLRTLERQSRRPATSVRRSHSAA